MLLTNLEQEEKSLLNSYIQSYLKWLYTMNDEFMDYFTTTDIVNFYLTKMNIPVAIDILNKINPIGVLVYTANFIEKNKKNDMAMIEITHKPIPFEKSLKSIKVKTVKETLMSDKQENFMNVILGNFNKKYETNFRIEQKIEKLTAKDASLLISILKRYSDKKVKVS